MAEDFVPLCRVGDDSKNAHAGRTGGQTKGSTSYTFAISLAHAERQEDSGTEGKEGCGDGCASFTPWVVFPPVGE
jgi:hypothetical protein